MKTVGVKQLKARRLAPLILATTLASAAVIWAAVAGGDETERWLLAARYTARVSFPLFLVPYSASSLFVLWSGATTRALLRNRRQWGLAFALAHTVHLGALIGFSVLADKRPSATTLIGGGTAYVLMFLMVSTSNDAAMRALGRWWKRLHRVGIHVLWGIFAFSYLGRLSDPQRWQQGAVLLPFALGALGLRVAASVRRRRVTRSGVAVARFEAAGAGLEAAESSQGQRVWAVLDALEEERKGVALDVPLRGAIEDGRD